MDERKQVATVADNQTGLNAQYTAPPFGLGGDYTHTGAAGSPGLQNEPQGVGGGGVIASPVVSVPFASSQVQANMPRVPVTSGDTVGMSSDSVVPASGDPLTGLTAAYLTQTGAGHGHYGHFVHPTSMNGGA